MCVLETNMCVCEISEGRTVDCSRGRDGEDLVRG